MSTGSNRFPYQFTLIVIVVEQVERRLEELHQAGGAADILRRSPPLYVDESRVVDIGLASPSDSTKMSCRSQKCSSGMGST